MSIIHSPTPDRFSADDLDLALTPLGVGNRHWRDAGGKPVGDAQLPGIIATSCSAVPPAAVRYNVRELNRIFESSNWGNQLGATDRAGVALPLEKMLLPDERPSAKLAAWTVHHCQRGGCRRAPSHSTNPTVMALADAYGNFVRGVRTEATGGIQFLDIPGVFDKLPEDDRMALRLSTMRMLTGSNTFTRNIANGNLIIAESYFDNDTGKVSYASIACSSNTGLDIPIDVVKTIIGGGGVSDEVMNAHPGLRELQFLVLGNDSYILRRAQEPTHNTKYIIDGCADARADPYVIMSPALGLVEVIRSAGSATNQKKVKSWNLAVTAALEANGYREPIVGVFFSHYPCAAVNTTLEHLKGQLAPAFLTPLVDRMIPRLAHLSGAEQMNIDSRTAAQANALGALQQLLTWESPEANFLRDLVERGHLKLFGAIYDNGQGVVEFSPEIKFQL